MKHKIKYILIGIVIGSLLFTGIGVIAAQLFAEDIIYNNTNVESALNDLYSKANKQAVQVATLTTRGATYTMQNDGYITGTASRGSSRMAILYINNKTYALSNWESSDNTTYYVSMYATKGSVVNVRSDGGTYNLTVYEWK